MLASTRPRTWPRRDAGYAKHAEIASGYSGEDTLLYLQVSSVCLTLSKSQASAPSWEGAVNWFPHTGL